MSIPATTAAWLADVRPPARKLVLLYMADRHNGRTGLLNPGIAKIASACGLTPSQVRRHLQALKADGLLSVTANANGGRPGLTPHYCFHLTGSAGAQEGAHRCARGVAPMRETASAHATQTGMKQNEPADNRKYTRKPALARPDDVPESVWEGFLAIRNVKRAPLSKIAMDGIKREASLAGITLSAALEMCCEKGWAWFDAEWIKPSARRAPVAENFAAKDYGTGELL